MVPAVVGQLGLQAAKDLIDRLFGKGGGSVPGFGNVTVRPGGRAGQIVIVNGPVIIGGPDRGAADTRAVIECALSLLARLPGIEVTFRLSEGGALEAAVRRAAGAGSEGSLRDALARAAADLPAADGPAWQATIEPDAPLAAGSLGKGHNEVYLLTSRQRLQHRWYWPEPNWSPWENMGLPSEPVTVIAAGSKGQGHQELAIAARDAVHHRWWANDSWSGWHEMPRLGTPVADLAFSSNCEGALEIFALDQRGRISHRWSWRDGGWSEGWTLMDTPDRRPVASISAGSYADGHQELFAIVDGEIHHRWWWRDSGWSGWHRQAPAGLRATDIAVSSLMEGHLEVFALDETGRLRHRWYWSGPGNWSDWEDFPRPDGSKVTAIAVSSIGRRHQEIFGLKASGKVVHAWNWLKKDGKPNWESWSDWSKWTSMRPPAG